MNKLTSEEMNLAYKAIVETFGNKEIIMDKLVPVINTAIAVSRL